MTSTPSSLAARLRAGDRRALARAITLAESTRREDQLAAEALLAELLAHSGGSHRVALTGPPGAGKSTLVDALGAAALAAGQRVAVLAIDPASAISGGSLLGDAVRMQRLAASERAFVRPSSNAGTLGGTAPATREAILLCEAAGFDLVLVETVGVGQAEQAVRDACDTLVLVTLAGSGDEIQGMKRGLLEVADAVLAGKADGPGEAAAKSYAAELAQALALLRPASVPHTGAVSGKTGQGTRELLEWLTARHARLRRSGELASSRAQQLRGAFARAVSRELGQLVQADARLAALASSLEAAVTSGEKLPSAAARELVVTLVRA